MAIQLKKKWIGKQKEIPGAKSVYPTKYAQRVRSLQLSPDDPKAVKCYNCGTHIEDKQAVSKCPLCESDNFLGKVL